jgi:hypothetical protein
LNFSIIPNISPGFFRESGVVRFDSLHKLPVDGWLAFGSEKPIDLRKRTTAEESSSSRQRRRVRAFDDQVASIDQWPLGLSRFAPEDKCHSRQFIHTFYDTRRKLFPTLLAVRIRRMRTDGQDRIE